MRPSPGVEDFAIARETSPKNDFTFAVSMRFADQAAYDSYNRHPSHVASVRDNWEPEVAAFMEHDTVALVAGGSRLKCRRASTTFSLTLSRLYENEDRPPRWRAGHEPGQVLDGLVAGVRRLSGKTLPFVPLAEMPAPFGLCPPWIRKT